MCTPTRAALLTGLYQHRFGKKFEKALSGRAGKGSGLPLGALTIAEVLKKEGYATGMFGKWHLGYEQPFLPHVKDLTNSVDCSQGTVITTLTLIVRATRTGGTVRKLRWRKATLKIC